MTQQRASKRSSDPPQRDTPVTDAAEQQAEWSPRARKAAEAVRRAEAELERAQQFYQKVRQEAADSLRTVREKNVADLVEGTLEVVKRHPGPGVIVAAMIGFFLGRLFRR
jgi:ElaB/YqjD/DUF883 family membrane-anchored ribosome-binding protein